MHRSLMLVVCMLAAGAAQAAGYSVDTQAGRATGMGLAVTGWIDDASAAFYNPAGLARGKRLELQLGDTLIAPQTTFTLPSGGQTTSQSSPVYPPHLYGVWGISDLVSVGLAINAPFGVALTWPPDWVGKQLITHSALTVFEVDPSCALQFGGLRIGVGVQLVRGSVDLERTVAAGPAELNAKVSGTALGVGGNIGLQYSIFSDTITLGATYRSAVKLPFAGTAQFSNVPPPLAAGFSDQTVKTEITLPDSVGLGVGLRPVEALQLGFDAIYTAWQRFPRLALEFENPQLSSTQEKNWHYTWSFRLGGEVALGVVRLRAGAIFDPTPSPAETLSPDLPDANRLNLALGAGVHLDGFRIDLGYQHVILMNNESTFPLLPGTYSGKAEVLSLTLGYTTK